LSGLAAAHYAHSKMSGKAKGKKHVGTETDTSSGRSS